MNYRSIHDMNRTILNNLHKVPADIQVVAGIPLSGMLAALMLGLHRSLVVTELDGLIGSKAMPGGTTTNSDSRNYDDYLKSKRKVLVIDDSYYRGKTLEEVKKRLNAANLRHEILYAVVYGGLRAKDIADIVFERLLPPHVFEWNLSRNVILKTSCVDMDGVLCQNPMPIENDNGQRYMRFLEKAEPLWRPNRELGWIVTSRLEKYRMATEKWLKDQGIKYQHLFMMDAENQLARRRLSIPEYKSAIFQSVNADLFIESSFAEASEIALLTKRNILCFETGELIPASRYEEFKNKLRKPDRFITSPFLYAGYWLRKYPEDHIIVGPIKRMGRYIHRLLKQWRY